MKKKILFLISVLSLFFASAIPCHAMQVISNESQFSFYMFTNSIKGCTSVQIAAILFLIVIVLFSVFRKKLVKMLKNSSTSSMLNAFIVFFSVFGIGCLVMAFISDGTTWSGLMHYDTNSESIYTQFSDYILTIQDSGAQRFAEKADAFTPLSLLIYFTLAQFLPTKLVLSESMLSYASILRNQTFMFLYLILVMICIVLIYRMNRYILRRNGLNMRDELVVFLTVVSYPTMYCVELGNIVGFSLALSLFFIIYHDAKQKVFRELSHIAMGISAAITPLTILFVLILIDEKKKKAVIDILKIVLYSAILFITPCIFTGFDCLTIYAKNFFSISADAYQISNMSIANLLIFFGIDNQVLLQVISVLMNIIAVAAIILLPKTWQKMSAAVYIILNVFSISSPMMLIFIFIPFVFLLAEKTHKASDWLYLLVFALLITPFPEWFYFDRAQFNIFTLSLGIRDIRNANNLISLAATQGLFALICCQTISTLKCRRQKNT